MWSIRGPRAGQGLLDATPGPSPWYIPRWPAPAGLSWSKADDAGNAVATAADGRILLVIPMYTRLLGVSHAEATLMRDARETAEITTYRFGPQTPGLEPSAVAAALARAGRERAGILAAAEPAASVALPLGQEAGRHAVPALDVPSLADDVGFPATGPIAALRAWRYFLPPGPGEPADARPNPAPAPAATSLYLWRPREGSLLVVPLPWFNDKTADLGYQWVTRCVREPATGRIFADGIRVDAFAVDESGKAVWGNALRHGA